MTVNYLSTFDLPIGTYTTITQQNPSEFIALLDWALNKCKWAPHPKLKRRVEASIPAETMEFVAHSLCSPHPSHTYKGRASPSSFSQF